MCKVQVYIPYYTIECPLVAELSKSYVPLILKVHVGVESGGARGNIYCRTCSSNIVPSWKLYLRLYVSQGSTSCSSRYQRYIRAPLQIVTSNHNSITRGYPSIAALVTTYLTGLGVLSVWPGEIIFFFDFLVCSSNCTCLKISLRNALRFEGERLVPFFDNDTQI